MKRVAAFIFLGLLLALVGGAGDTSPATDPSPTSSGVTFAAVNVFIDPHGKTLACYQIQIVATGGDVALVGIEGGESAAYNSAPYYDPRALQGKRIIIGAYSLANELPSEKTRVATLMVQVTGNAVLQYRAMLQVAASSDGKSIPATVTLEPVITSRNSQINGAAR